MPGGLVQLVAFGAQNYLLNGNPSVSFFKKVYKTHTNFAMESMRVVFNKNYMKFKESTTLISKIKRNGDLVQDMYFVFELPEIPKVIRKNENGVTIGDDFRFVKNLGEAIVEEYYIYIGGTIVNRQYGEWMHIWNELSIPTSKRYGYDKLIGNVPDVYIPDAFNRVEDGAPQINKRKIYVPLKFWFNRNPGLALPLVALQYHDVEVHVLLRPMNEVYTINDQKPTQWVTEGAPYFGSNDVIPINPYLEVNYIFLDDQERKHFATNEQDYLIEQINRIEVSNISRMHMSDLMIQNPVKELVWVLSRNDTDTKNRWFDYTDYSYGSSDQHDKEILESAKLVFNGVDRFEEKDGAYFNLIQPYQHHSVIPKAGVYVYSFSLFPESFQPSGSCNMSRLKSIQLQTTVCKLPPNSSYGYDMRVYVTSYNFLRITSGLGGLAFTS